MTVQVKVKYSSKKNLMYLNEAGTKNRYSHIDMGFIYKAILHLVHYYTAHSLQNLPWQTEAEASSVGL